MYLTIIPVSLGNSVDLILAPKISYLNSSGGEFVDSLTVGPRPNHS